MASHVTRVSRFSTGTVEIHPQHAYRGRAPTYWWILTSRRWLEPRPINVYVIEHDDGIVLFDTGQDRASVVDPSYFPDGPNGVIYRRLARFHVSADETLPAGLERLGYRPADVSCAVVSHLHQDHIGGIADVPQSDLLVSADEWRSLHRPLPEARGLLRSHIEIPGARWTPIDYEPLDDAALQPFTHGHDVFGDGSLTILPTPGHTGGSLSMFVRRAEASPLLLVGDLTYDVHALEHGISGGVGRQRALRATRTKVMSLRAKHPGLRVLAAHDPAAALLLDATSVQGARLAWDRSA